VSVFADVGEAGKYVHDVGKRESIRLISGEEGKYLHGVREAGKYVHDAREGAGGTRSKASASWMTRRSLQGWIDDVFT
jgi:hypothetical protein